MSEEDIEELVDEPIEQEEPEQPSEEELSALKEAEDEARKYGWRPKEEYTRDPEGWVDANRFLELPSTQLKAMRDQRKELQAALEAERRERQDTFSRLEATQKKALERAREQERQRYETQIAQLQAQKRQAANEHDLERYDRLNYQEHQLREEQSKVSQPEPEQPQVDPLVVEYHRSNEWAQNPLLWQEAAQSIDIAMRMGRQFSNTQEQLEYAENTMRQKYPHMFQPKQTQPAPSSRVESGGLATGAKRGKGADDLPPEAKQAGKELVAEGIYKNMAEYAKDFWAQ